MEKNYKLLVDSFGKDKFKFDVEIREYTELQVGGKSKLFFIAFTIRELTKIIAMCRELRLNFFLFGTGSKIMISDNGFDGLVIKNRTKNFHIVSVKGKVSKFGIGIEEALVEVESGISMKKFAESLDREGLQSEMFLGIPGSVGGNLFINNLLQRSAKSIKVLDWKSEIWDIEPKELSLKKHIILSSVFAIKAK